MPKFDKKIVILVLLALIGLVLSSLLLSQHYTHLRDGFGERSFCTLSQLVNCDAVDASDYSNLYGVPVAGLGFLYYLTLLFYFLRISFSVHSIGKASDIPTEPKEISIFCYFLTTGACLITLVMAYFSAFELGVLCLLCAGMYLVNFTLLLLMPCFLQIKWRTLFSSRLLKPRFLQHVVAGFILMMVGSVAFYEIGQTAEYESYRSAKQNDIPIEGRPVWGNPHGKIIVVEFTDFQCRYCKEFQKKFKPVLDAHPNEIGFYFINYPFDTACNPDLKKQLHPLACELARIGICAHQKGVFWPYHDLIFDRQEGLEKSEILEHAKSIGLDSVWLSHCLNAPETTNLLRKDMTLAKEMNVRGTPSVFINGKRLRAWHNQKLLNRILMEEMK